MSARPPLNRVLIEELHPSLRLGSIWLRPVPDHPGIYASCRGEIWSIRSGKWRKLKATLHGGRKWDSRGGYLAVRVRDYADPGRAKRTMWLRVHLAVITAWVGPRLPHHEVDHMNNNHLDNTPGNLRYLHKDLHQAKHKMTDEDWESIL